MPRCSYVGCTEKLESGKNGYCVECRALVNKENYLKRKIRSKKENDIILSKLEEISDKMKLNDVDKIEEIQDELEEVKQSIKIFEDKVMKRLRKLEKQ